MPPLVGVAVNVRLVPAQVGFVPDVMAMLTLAGKFGLTVTEMLFDVAGEPVKHGEALLVKTTVTASLLFNAAVVKLAVLAPALTPFILH